MNGRPLTLIEQTRRGQLIDVAIGLVADHGYAATTLQRIADGAGITKAAVLYHFPSKDAVVSAAYEKVLGGLVEHVGAVVEAATARDAPGGYVHEMVGHFRRRPREARMIIEAVVNDSAGDDDPRARWRPLADLLREARAALDRPSWPDDQLRSLAIIVGGGVDGIVAEQLAHPDFDSAGAAEALVSMLEARLAS